MMETYSYLIILYNSNGCFTCQPWDSKNQIQHSAHLKISYRLHKTSAMLQESCMKWKELSKNQLDALWCSVRSLQHLQSTSNLLRIPLNNDNENPFNRNLDPSLSALDKFLCFCWPRFITSRREREGWYFTLHHRILWNISQRQVGTWHNINQNNMS